MKCAQRLRATVWRLGAALALVMAGCFGCGYHFSGTQSLPQGVTSVTFADFRNESSVPGAEKELQWAIEREFRNHGGISVSEGGEGVVYGTLRNIYVSPLTSDRRDVVLEYQASLSLDVTLTHRDTGEVLWQARDMEVVDDYAAVPEVVVTTSPRFLQGTLDPGDLPGMTDIQFGESQRRLAIERLLNRAAREVFFRLGENF